jgi:hypothetical protein
MTIFSNFKKQNTRGHWAWTLGLDIGLGHGTWTWDLDMGLGHGTWTWDADMGCGHGTWTQDADILHKHLPWRPFCEDLARAWDVDGAVGRGRGRGTWPGTGDANI